MGSPFEATLPYRVMHLTVWAADDILLALGAQSVAALYQPLRLCHASLGSLAIRCLSIFSAATAACFAQSPLSPAVICLPVRWAAYCDSFPCCHSAALLSISTHVGVEIHWLCGWARVGGATTSRWSSLRQVVSLSRCPRGSLTGNFAICLQ